ncbi:4-hydroxyacetophenone monooxygenase, partial [Burkholderia sp. SIMBA_019]
LDPRNGKNTTLWPGFTWRFRQATASFSIGEYQVFRKTHHQDAELPLSVAAHTTHTPEAA